MSGLTSQPSMGAIVAAVEKTKDDTGINRLFAYCKGGNFNIHI